MIQSIPSDPIILLSFLNTRLRDNYTSLDALCEDLDIERVLIEDKMKEIGYTYDPEQNKFV